MSPRTVFSLRLWLLLPLLVLSRPPAAATTVSLRSSPPVVLENRENVVLRGLRISGAPDNCVLLRNCRNVLIEQCEFGPAGGEGVHIISCTSVTVTAVRAERVRTGVYAVSSDGIRVTDSRFLNMQGPMPRGQFVQFDKVRGGGNRITGNRGENQPGKSRPEDAISLYMSSGLPEDPILVSGNEIRGGGPSPSGGGIMAGDGGGAHIVIRGNRLMDPGQYGIAIAGGESIQLLDNVIVGRPQPFTNVGLYVWNQHAEECARHRVRGNRVAWFRHDGVRNGAWNAGNCGAVEGWEDNDWIAELDLDPVK